MEAGQRGSDTVVTITAKNIAGYAAAALCDDARYRRPAADALAMPTMALSYAPLLREEIAAANGFTALEAVDHSAAADAFRQMRNPLAASGMRRRGYHRLAAGIGKV